ncbi:MAG: hypothetical protein ACTSUE_13620 [Promethearchaeota archaeon]
MVLVGSSIIVDHGAGGFSHVTRVGIAWKCSILVFAVGFVVLIWRVFMMAMRKERIKLCCPDH